MQVQRFAGLLLPICIEEAHKKATMVRLAGHLTWDLVSGPPGESTAASRLPSNAAHEHALAVQGCTNQPLQDRAIDEHVALDWTARRVPF
jgi:hypothetical protein